jgi:hypothetical protein
MMILLICLVYTLPKDFYPIPSILFSLSTQFEPACAAQLSFLNGHPKIKITLTKNIKEYLSQCPTPARATVLARRHFTVARYTILS